MDPSEMDEKSFPSLIYSKSEEWSTAYTQNTRTIPEKDEKGEKKQGFNLEQNQDCFPDLTQTNLRSLKSDMPAGTKATGKKGRKRVKQKRIDITH